MKKILMTIMVAVLFTVTSIASAEGYGRGTSSSAKSVAIGSVSDSDSNAKSKSKSQASNAGYNSVGSNNISKGSDLSKAVPAAIAPALTTTLTETCMGSTSVGVGVSGLGLSFGTTWRDSACVRRLDARQIGSLGFPGAGKELMCDSQAVFAAFARAGIPCVPRED